VEGSAGRSFNTSLTAGSAALETVARVTRGGHRLDACDLPPPPLPPSELPIAL
jgi:hypothetical protein